MAILKVLKNMKHGASRLVIASAVIALGLGGICSNARADAGSGLSAPIEGTWIVTVHRVNSGVTFTALMSFTAGGVTVATGTIDRTPPPPISPLYGSWKRTSGNNYATKLCFFLFNLDGTAVGMLKNLLHFRLVGENNLVGGGPAVICEPTGDNCVDTGESITITGKRLLPEGASN